MPSVDLEEPGAETLISRELSLAPPLFLRGSDARVVGVGRDLIVSCQPSPLLLLRSYPFHSTIQLSQARNMPVLSDSFLHSSPNLYYIQSVFY